MKNLKRDDLLYPELSYQISGILFEVYNTLGFGYQEKYYQKAIAALLKKANIKFVQEIQIEVKIADEVIAKGRDVNEVVPPDATEGDINSPLGASVSTIATALAAMEKFPTLSFAKML
jgi:hypothetical protein